MKYFPPKLLGIKPTIVIFFLLLCYSSLFSQESMRASLYISDVNGLTLVDGNFTNYDDVYCNCVDWDDAWKMNNPGENFGISRENSTLIVERRKLIDEKDTTTFRIWNLQQNRNYRVVLLNQQLNHPFLFAFFKDNYLGIIVPINLDGTSTIDFNIDTNPASYAINRFQLVFEKTMGAPMPVSFRDVKAYRKSGIAMVEWQVENEISISKYIVEKSIDGRKFNAIQEIIPGLIYSTGYQSKDIYVSLKENFYRIKAINVDGKEQISAVVKLNAQDNAVLSSVSVYPNPVINKNLHLKMADFPVGKYAIQLLGVNGIIFNLKTVIVLGNQLVETLPLPKTIPAGIYRLMIIGQDNTRKITNVNIL